MKPDQETWQTWARNLQQWGIGDWVAALLEAAGPLTILGAQTLYLGQPVLRQALPEKQLQALAEMLEEPVRTRAFINYLREKPQA